MPLVLQTRYRADGWLGALCGSKLYIDFSQEADISKSLDALVKELNNRGKLPQDCEPHQCDSKIFMCGNKSLTKLAKQNSRQLEVLYDAFFGTTVSIFNIL